MDVKKVAILIHGKCGELFEEECLRQADALSAGEAYGFSLLHDTVPGEAEEAFDGDFDLLLYVDSSLSLSETAFSVLLENSAFVGDKAVVVGSVSGPDGAVVYGGRQKNGRIVEPDLVIPVPCRSFDAMLLLRPTAELGRSERRQFVVAPGVLASCAAPVQPQERRRSFLGGLFGGLASRRRKKEGLCPSSER